MVGAWLWHQPQLEKLISTDWNNRKNLIAGGNMEDTFTMIDRNLFAKIYAWHLPRNRIRVMFPQARWLSKLCSMSLV